MNFFPAISLRLSRQPQWIITIYSAFICFSVYSAAFIIRKAFIAAKYDHMQFAGVDYKVWLVCAQVLGYMMSKFFGIKFIAENQRNNQALLINKLLLISWIALLGFALVPAPYNIVFFFLNGFPLGMIWGLLFSYIEGRRTTELMGALLTSSFIFSSGFAKSAGEWLLKVQHINEQWMPFVIGAVFLSPTLLFTRLLSTIPPPDLEDNSLRSERKPMQTKERKAFLARFLGGLVMVIIAYTMLTILRDFRDNFAPEILSDIGLNGSGIIFAQTEIGTTLLVLAVMGTFIIIRDNRKAFILCHWISVGGLVITLGVTYLFSKGELTGYWWYLLTGVGLYIGYIPFNCIYFERMLATYQISGNVGFIMYLADSFGYLGSMTVSMLKGFGTLHLTWSGFFMSCIYFVGFSGILLIILSLFYFKHKLSTHIATNKA